MENFENRKILIGKRIEKERTRKNLSKKDLLNQIYMAESSHKTISAWEKGERMPDLTSLARMADVFQCDIGYLLGDYNERTRISADIVEETKLSEAAVSLIIKIGIINKNLSHILSLFLTSTNFIDFLLLIHYYRNHALFAQEYQKQVDQISQQIDKEIATAGISELSAMTDQMQQKKEACQKHCDAKEIVEYKIQKQIFSILKELEVINNG